ncbi:endoglucanase F-like isoform X2 [Ptychodera flava]|uniref:endoglucanase F-like isoform X2 n=1 Tax=Ptychodera flava TaxID=63121 RepID=UPI00396A6AA2
MVAFQRTYDLISAIVLSLILFSFKPIVHSQNTCCFHQVKENCKSANEGFDTHSSYDFTGLHHTLMASKDTVDTCDALKNLEYISSHQKTDEFSDTHQKQRQAKDLGAQQRRESVSRDAGRYGGYCVTKPSAYSEQASSRRCKTGDYVKFGLPMAWSTTVLAWGLIAYRDAYETSGQLQYMLDCIKWPADYFLKAHTKEDEFYYQVGDPEIDHKYWGRAENMSLPRPSFKVDPSNPGSDVTGETAAALAACAIGFKDINTSYASLLLKHSKQLYNFANTHRANRPTRGPYKVNQSFGYMLAWAAVWLYFATSDKKFLDDAKLHYQEFHLHRRAWSFAWGNPAPGVQLLLYILTREDMYRDHFVNYLDGWLPNSRLAYTPKGLVFRAEWGALRYAANNAFLALVAADHGIKTKAYRQFAKSQIHYILGDTGRSFVVGFGKNPPKRPHHRASSCPSPPAKAGNSHLLRDAPNPYILYGAVVGGPGRFDNYVDDRKNYKMNEVACDYNAGFQSAVAGLKHLDVTGQL